MIVKTYDGEGPFEMKEEIASCRECGELIVWAKTKDEKKISIDPRPFVYELIGQGYCRRRFAAYVDHSEICPKKDRND